MMRRIPTGACIADCRERLRQEMRNQRYHDDDSDDYIGDVDENDEDIDRDMRDVPDEDVVV